MLISALVCRKRENQDTNNYIQMRKSKRIPKNASNGRLKIIIFRLFRDPIHRQLFCSRLPPLLPIHNGVWPGVVCRPVKNAFNIPFEQLHIGGFIANGASGKVRWGEWRGTVELANPWYWYWHKPSWQHRYGWLYVWGEMPWLFGYTGVSRHVCRETRRDQGNCRPGVKWAQLLEAWVGASQGHLTGK